MCEPQKLSNSHTRRLNRHAGSGAARAIRSAWTIRDRLDVLYAAAMPQWMRGIALLAISHRHRLASFPLCWSGLGPDTAMTRKKGRRAGRNSPFTLRQ